jgi:hypothetical protein
MEDQRSKNSAFEVGDAAVERGGSFDDNGSVLSDNSGGSLGKHAYYPLLWK